MLIKDTVVVDGASEKRYRVLDFVKVKQIWKSSLVLKQELITYKETRMFFLLLGLVLLH